MTTPVIQRGYSKTCALHDQCLFSMKNDCRHSWSGHELRVRLPSMERVVFGALVLLSSQLWPIPSMSRRVINCAKLCLSHPSSRIKWIRQWGLDQDPVLTSTTSDKIGKTAKLCSTVPCQYRLPISHVKSHNQLVKNPIGLYPAILQAAATTCARRHVFLSPPSAHSSYPASTRRGSPRRLPSLLPLPPLPAPLTA